MNFSFPLAYAALFICACSTNDPDASIVDGSIADAISSSDASLSDAGLSDASHPDATVPICDAPEIVVAPLPQPSNVPAGTSCIGDSDCTAVGGFCRSLSGGGSECTAFQGNGGGCGGLPAPNEQERCVPGLQCDAVNAQTAGTCICAPQCEDKVCGSDGCGSICGPCDGVCAAEGTICNDFEADQCCFPATVNTLPFVRNGRTEGAQDTFPVPSLFGSPQDPDEVIQFTPTRSGEYFFWGDCHDSAVYDDCESSATAIDETACTEASLFSAAPLRVSLTANQDYFVGAQTGPGLGGYTQQIHGPITIVADLASPNISSIAVDSTHVYWAAARPFPGHCVMAAVLRQS